MTALVLDAGALVAVDRGDRAMVARLRAAQANGLTLRTNAMVVSQAWRNPNGRQAALTRLLRAVDIRPIDHRTGKAAGELLGAADTKDAVAATVVLLADTGDRIVTSDPADLTRLAAAADRRVAIVPC